MNKKLLGTALIAASSTALMSGCGILETLEDVDIPIPQLRFDSNSYIVQPGDTLDSVASRYKIDPDSLLNINSLELAKLVPGQRLLLLRDDEVGSMATANRTAATSTRVPIAGGEATAVGQPIVVPNATQTTVTALPRSVEDPTIIRTDVLVPSQGEEIIGVVEVSAKDDLLDDQPIFVPEADMPQTLENPILDTPVAAVERPQGVETIVQEVKAGETVAMVDPSVPSAGTIEIVDANSNAPAKRITVNNHDKGWNWPALGTITREFDLREINRQGLDIDPGPGAAVQAAADGEVVYSGRDLASYGNLVILRHDDNFLSAYSKVSDIFVKENQKVKAGDLLASVGGNESGSTEIHFEIRRNGEPVNPIDYLPAL